MVKSQLMAAGELAIRAAGNIQIDLKGDQRPEREPGDRCDAMAAGLAWLKKWNNAATSIGGR
ncbi:hypothetical protein [Azonexus hydrophilus]